MTESPDLITAVEAAAQKYRSDGYRIDFHPPKTLLPESVRSFQPNFIAMQGDTYIAVEVKSRASLRNDEQIRRYAELFRNLPGWRLDLVVIPDSPAMVPECKLLSKALVRKRLDTADKLTSDPKDLGGAIILLWTAIEAPLRSEINDADRLPIVSGSRLVKESLSLGLITEKEQEILDRLVSIRNQVAHGEFTPLATKAIYRDARSIASRLIESLD